MIHAPALLPDEDANGYWGRVMRLNAVLSLPTNEEAFRAHVRRSCGGELSGRSEAALTVSHVGNVALDVLVRSHTLVPLHGAVLTALRGSWSDDSYQCWILRQEAVSRPLYGAKLCPGCIREDLDFWGFSYWRRSHQIHGVVMCAKHQRPLMRVLERISWRHMPGECAERAAPFTNGVLADVHYTPVLQRYADVCHELLVRAAPTSTVEAIMAFGEQAKRLGLAAESSDAGTRLCELAIDQIAGPWQKCFWRDLPLLAQGKSGALLDATLHKLTMVPRGIDYAMAIALLYESIDDAFLDLRQAADKLAALRRCPNAADVRDGMFTEEKQGRSAAQAAPRSVQAAKHGAGKSSSITAPAPQRASPAAEADGRSNTAQQILVSLQLTRIAAQ